MSVPEDAVVDGVARTARVAPSHGPVDPADGTGVPAPWSWRQRGHFAVLVMITVITAILGSLGNPLIPSIAQDRGIPLSAAQWALTASLLTSAIATPLLGRAASGTRRRPLILAVLALVTLGSVLTVLPLGFGVLVAGRALQGFGMALVPLVFAIARETIPPARQTSAIAWLSVTAVVGSGLGYPITGVTADLWGTTGAFLLGLGVSLATLVAVAVGLPRSPPEPPAPVDWTGGLLLGSGTLALLLVLTQGDGLGWTSRATLALLAVAVVLLAGCTWWMLRRRFPLIDLRLATRRGVIAPNVAGALLSCGMFVMFSLTMIVVQAEPEEGFGQGRSVLIAGLLLTPYAGGNVLGSRLSLLLGRSVAPDRIFSVGGVLFVAATMLLAFRHDSLWQLLLVMVLGGLGSGFSFATLPALIMAHVPPAETGSAMSVNMVLRYLGYAAGSALALAVLDVFAAPGGQPTQTGFTASALTGAGVCLLGLLAAVALPRAPVAGRAG